MLVNFLARSLGWRHSLELLGAAILLVLVPVGFWVTRSSPGDVTAVPDSSGEVPPPADNSSVLTGSSVGVSKAIRSPSFWLLLIGYTLAIGAIGAVIQHFILFLKDIGYSAAVACQYSTILLTATLGVHAIVGHLT